MFSLFEYWNSDKSLFDARSLKRDIQTSLVGIATDNQVLTDPKVIYENYHLQRKFLKIDINGAAGDGVGVKIYRETVKTRKLRSEDLPPSVSPLAEIIRLKINNSNEILRGWRPNATNYWSYYIPEKTPRRSIVRLYLSSPKYNEIDYLTALINALEIKKFSFQLKIQRFATPVRPDWGVVVCEQAQIEDILEMFLTISSNYDFHSAPPGFALPLFKGVSGALELSTRRMESYGSYVAKEISTMINENRDSIELARICSEVTTLFEGYKSRLKPKSH